MRSLPTPKAWEVSARAADGLRSQSKIAAQERAASAMGGSAAHDPPMSTRFGAARLSLKGASGGPRTRQCLVPDMCNRGTPQLFPERNMVLNRGTPQRFPERNIVSKKKGPAGDQGHASALPPACVISGISTFSLFQKKFRRRNL